MMIDVHTHIGYYRNYAKDMSRTPLTAADLVRGLDRMGIEKACVLPLVSPECTATITDPLQIIDACAEFPDRLIPFANIDPRSCGNRPDADFLWLLEEYKGKGCRGLGEVTANIAFDDERTLNFLRQCGEAGLPVTFHMTATFGGEYGLVDEKGMPGLEKALQTCPDTIIVGHAPCFWAEITGDVTEEDRQSYPDGPVAEGGRIQALMDAYPNLYADLSAGSAFKALSRDSEHALRFLETYRERLMFATDYLADGQECPIISFLDDLDLREDTRALLYHGNAQRIYEI